MLQLSLLLAKFLLHRLLDQKTANGDEMKNWTSWRDIVHNIARTTTQYLRKQILNPLLPLFSYQEVRSYGLNDPQVLSFLPSLLLNHMPSHIQTGFKSQKDEHSSVVSNVFSTFQREVATELLLILSNCNITTHDLISSGGEVSSVQFQTQLEVSQDTINKSKNDFFR